MHDWIDKRLGWIGIPHLPIILAAGQGLFLLATLGNPVLYTQMWLSWAEVLSGEVWRPLTFLFMPPFVSPAGGWRMIDVLFAFFAIYILWLMGTALEAQWGSARFTAFVALGWVLTMAAAWVDPARPATNFYIDITIFLAFAYLFPDFEFRLFFILPVKVKWLALITWIFLVLGFVFAVSAQAWVTAAVMAAGVANFFVFFGADVVRRVRGSARRMEMKRQAIIDQAQPMHTCCVSGWTERTHPEAEFRYVKEDGEVKCYAMEYLPDKYKQEQAG
ncbi:MAG: hypothetical protein AAF078_01740 [Planctomycetota bacterium]